MEKSRSWPSAHDWKSCIPQKGIEGSNPSFSAIKNPSPFGWGIFYGGEGDRIWKAVKKTCRWHVFRPWENPWTCERTHTGCGRVSICVSVFSNLLVEIVYCKWYTIFESIEPLETSARNRGIWAALILAGKELTNRNLWRCLEWNRKYLWYATLWVSFCWLYLLLRASLIILNTQHR